MKTNLEDHNFPDFSDFRKLRPILFNSTKLRNFILLFNWDPIPTVLGVMSSQRGSSKVQGPEFSEMYSVFVSSREDLDQFYPLNPPPTSHQN